MEKREENKDINVVTAIKFLLEIIKIKKEKNSYGKSIVNKNKHTIR